MTEPFNFDESLLLQAAYDAGNVESTSITPRMQPSISVDATHLFTTDQIFDTRDDLLKWVRNVGKENGYEIVIGKSDKGTSGGAIKVILLCGRNGVYVPYKDPKTFKYKTTRSKKCNCPFALKGRPTEGDRNWWLVVTCGEHNHEPARSLVGHSYAGRLTKEEKGQLGTMHKSWVAPRHMLLTLKEQNPGNLTTITQVYTCCKTIRKEAQGPLTEMQFLMKKLTEANYVHFERQADDSDVIRDVFWAHPDAIKLFNTFPHVVVMDCTYKTNKYRIPLLEMVGLTSTGKTFSIAFCYMTQERKHDYVWALECMKSLLADPVRLPGVFVTDKELALLSAVSETFPTSSNLICLFHIRKAVEAHCKKWVDKDNFKDIVMELWTNVVNAETEQQYEEEWREMCGMCNNYPRFTKYISSTWLTHKEKFVKAWTNNVMHFGNTTSNRAESAHAALKKMLRNSKGNLCNSWDAVDRLTTLRHNEIRASFERSINITEHRFKSKMYVNVRGFVAEKALQLMHDERDRVWSQDEVCGCHMKVTHGLPCACALQRYTSIPNKAVDPFWKLLSWEQVPVLDSQTSNSGDIPYEIEALVAHYSTLDDAGQSMLRRKVKELYCPQSSSLCPPEVKIKTKRSSKAKGSKPSTREPIGSLKRDLCHWEHVNNNTAEARNPTVAKCPPPTIRSRNPSSQASKSKNKNPIKKPPPSIYLGYLPSFFLPYIDEVIDVDGDGNCGYRAVAALLDHPKGQNGWPWVRERLMKELELHHILYTNMWGFDIVQALHLRLTLPHDQRATDDKWMHLPEMGYLIATTFEVVFISISEKSSWTYLPLIGAPPEVHRIIAVGHVPNHFVQLKLLHGHPMPYIAPQWQYNVIPPTSEWIDPYNDRVARFAVEHTAWRAAIGGPNVNDYIDITID